eukprot:CAMPEP_0172635514 /NCGR_PEP_ID=MMETSP1068-20121228/199786_1 /TAXON_ID=35684 /ORGANISM="Pseudopedinella elastica, Strain CCMP716" /LENGTH=88 /DNA_ID=CAMNT_0013447763 /DNA_START=24 /DNA_END=287 /DNA_ORIENTATION=+
MAGAHSRARLKRSRTRAAPRPTSVSTNSLALAKKKGTLASLARARASSVFPVPAGPDRRTPRGMRAPMATNLVESLRKSTSSCSSCLA